MLICILADKLKKLSAGVYLVGFSGGYFAEGSVFLLSKDVFLTLSLTRTRAGRTRGLRGQPPTGKNIKEPQRNQARLAQSVERKALNLVVVGSSPTVGVFHPGAP